MLSSYRTEALSIFWFGLKNSWRDFYPLENANAEGGDRSILRTEEVFAAASQAPSASYRSWRLEARTTLE